MFRVSARFPRSALTPCARYPSPAGHEAFLARSYSPFCHAMTSNHMGTGDINGQVVRTK